MSAVTPVRIVQLAGGSRVYYPSVEAWRRTPSCAPVLMAPLWVCGSLLAFAFTCSAVGFAIAGSGARGASPAPEPLALASLEPRA